MSYTPIRIDAAAAGHASDGDDDVHDEECEGQEHAEDHDGESRAGADQAEKGEIVVLFDYLDQFHCCEDPPGVPLRSTDFSLS